MTDEKKQEMHEVAQALRCTSTPGGDCGVCAHRNDPKMCAVCLGHEDRPAWAYGEAAYDGRMPGLQEADR